MKPKPKTGIRRALALAEVARGARLDRNYLLLVGLSASIAMLGMLQNSMVVVIGAMLLSPLMGPIMGIGFGLAIFDNRLIKRSVTSLLAGMAVAILVSASIAFISPIRDVTQEITSRTHPSLFDLGIAVVGGIAGVFAIIKRNSGVMVGVAIATTLMPPLATIGFGMVTGRPDFALAAGLLFLTNALAIALTATVMARLNSFGPFLSAKQTMVQSAGIITVLGILSVPLALSLNRIVMEVRARTVVRAQLQAVLGPEARVSTLQINQTHDLLTVDAVAIVPRYAPGAGNALQSQIATALSRKAAVNLVQIRSQSGETEAMQDQLESRVRALEASERSANAIITLLMQAGIPRQNLLIDAQARRIVINRDPERNADSQVEQTIDAVLTEVQAKYPGWLVLTGRLQAPKPMPDAANAATDRPE